MRIFIVGVIAALSLIAAPASAQVVEPVLYEPCENTEGFDGVITVDEAFEGTVTTPVQPLLMSEEDAGSYLLDLSGLEEGTKARVTMTLAWDTPAGLGDYDLIINGSNEEAAGDTPETHLLTNQTHCKAFDLATTAFSGTPLDTLTLTISAR